VSGITHQQEDASGGRLMVLPSGLPSPDRRSRLRASWPPDTPSANIKPGREARALGYATLRYVTIRDASPIRVQATLRNTLVTPLLSGSVVSVATFWASAASSLVCSETASNCLRACEVESSMISENDFTSSSSRA
jgi:hypothetical protein